MKSALSLTLIGCLVGSTLTVAAQDRMEATPDRIARAVTREAVRLAAAPHGQPADSNWSHVRRPEPGYDTTQNRGRVLGHRRLMGALIGAGSGITVGYAVGSRCGPGAPREECAADGWLTAAVLGGLGALVGAAIAATTSP